MITYFHRISHSLPNFQKKPTNQPWKRRRFFLLLILPSLSLPPFTSFASTCPPQGLFSVPVNPQTCRIAVVRKRMSFRTKATRRGNVQMTEVPTSVPVRVAHELHQAGHTYLDFRLQFLRCFCRTPEECSVGHVPGAINIPYFYRLGSGMAKNPRFPAEVSAHFGQYDEIIGCHLGKRSLMAATDLLAAGFTAVTDIARGYAAWTQNGLPRDSRCC
ncbi:Rhodanese-like domain-containing protein 15 [Hibiscus syriacus]|uniref:Rhodanese-like domain-containing protein 15 n=1 Tax=Hibiscus syriacus TaxID=106335 RepID=A0A6A2ZWT7_HIBSY|nr:Rhodanese-like domain-containing protein 15 [Hibiscus syriacus]